MITDDLLRGTGRTHRMILSLPTAGSIVVAPTEDLARCLRDSVEDVRGRAVADATLFVGQAREERVTRGRRLPVFRDHSCDSL